MVVHADSATVRALLECDSLGQVRLKQLQTANGLRLMQDFSLKGNLLIVTAKIDSMAIYLKFRSIYEKRTEAIRQIEKENYQEYKKIVTNGLWYWSIIKWVLICIAFGGAIYLFGGSKLSMVIKWIIKFFK